MNTKKKIIFITIESVKRELDSKTVLALKALKRNYRVVLGQKGWLRQVVKNTNPGIMFLKSFGNRNTQHIDFIKKKNFKIVAFDEELILAIDYEDKIEWRMNNENINKLDLILAVGEKTDYAILKKKFSHLIKKILVCGNMRLELLKKNYHKLLEVKSLEKKNIYGKYILLLTAFAQINKIRDTHQIDWVFSRIVEGTEREKGGKYIDPDSKHVFLGNEQVKMQRESLLQTLKFLDNFEKNFPNQNLVISPHPNENYNFWSYYVKNRKFKNIFLSKDVHSSSYPLINSCEILITCNSTSLIEAYFLGKKSINLLGKKFRESEIEIAKKVSTKVVRTSDELIKAINFLCKINNDQITNQSLDEFKNFDENFNCFEVVLNRLDDLENVKPHKDLFANFIDFLVCKITIFIYIFKRLIALYSKKHKKIFRFNNEKVGNALQKKNFIRNVMHINSLERVENIKIKQIAPEVFLLDKQ
jgi:surface carbohydrate biosynthesis protein